MRIGPTSHVKGESIAQGVPNKFKMDWIGFFNALDIAELRNSQPITCIETYQIQHIWVGLGQCVVHTCFIP